MSLIKIAQDTLAAIGAGKYTAPSGKTISISAAVSKSIKGSLLYGPDWLVGILGDINQSPTIEVTKESSLEAAYRLKDLDPCLLNFASAKHPGGGFLRGSSAQEESIARSSALYHTLMEHPEFYGANNTATTDIGLYQDYAIYSPRVPVIRDDHGLWLEEPYTVSVLTSPAPNRRAIFEKFEGTCEPGREQARERSRLEGLIKNTIQTRITQILSIMASHGHRSIILGAWGCGVFGNDPVDVAGAFKEALKQTLFFDNITFPIYDKQDSEVFVAFKEAFEQRT